MTRTAPHRPDTADARPTDPRRLRTRRRTLAAARAVLRREGRSGATVDAVAAEAGVARSTIYRNWPDLADLLAAAIEDGALPATGGTAATGVEAVIDSVEQLARALDGSEWGATLPAVVAAIDADAALADRYRVFTDGRRAELERRIRGAAAAGQLSADVPVGEVVDALVGPLFYRRLVRRVRTSPAAARRHATRTLAAFAAP